MYIFQFKSKVILFIKYTADLNRQIKKLSFSYSKY